MEFTANRKDLLSELSLFSGIVDQHPADLMSMFSNVCFLSSSGNCEMKASGGEIGLSSSLPAETSGDGKLSVPVVLLSEWLKHGAADEVTLTETERGWVQVRCGDHETQIPGRVGEAPSLESPPETSLCSISSSQLHEILKFGSHAVPGSGSAPQAATAGAQIEVTDQDVRIVSSDHSRLALASASVSSGSLDAGDRQMFGLGARTLSELMLLSRSTDCEVRFLEAGNHLFFEFGDRLLVSSKLAERLPDYEHVIPRECPVQVQVSRGKLLAAVQAALPFATGEYHRAKLNLSEESVAIEVASVRGEAQCVIEHARLEGQELSLHVNLGHVRDFARSMENEDVSLEFQTAETAYLLRPVGQGEEYLCVGMPLV